MKKRIVSIIFAVIMIVGMLPLSAIPAFAEEEEKSDVIRFGLTNPKESDNRLFALATTYSNEGGWYGGGGYTLTINAAKGLIITRIEAEISNHYDYYSEVGVSGDAVKENYPEKDGDTVTVSNINSSKFSFTGGSNYIQFKNVTVYYTCTHSIVENGICKRCHYVDESTHEHIFDDNRNCACGKTKCEAGEHDLENGFCKFCDFFDESTHEHIFDDNNVCACGKTKCDVDGHSYKYYCEFCGEEAPENLPAETTGLGSTFSGGNLWLIGGIAVVVIIGVAAYVVVKKKKITAAAGAAGEASSNHADEE